MRHSDDNKHSAAPIAPVHTDKRGSVNKVKLPSRLSFNDTKAVQNGVEDHDDNVTQFGPPDVSIEVEALTPLDKSGGEDGDDDSDGDAPSGSFLSADDKEDEYWSDELFVPANASGPYCSQRFGPKAKAADSSRPPVSAHDGDAPKVVKPLASSSVEVAKLRRENAKLKLQNAKTALKYYQAKVALKRQHVKYQLRVEGLKMRAERASDKGRDKDRKRFQRQIALMTDEKVEASRLVKALLSDIGELKDEAREQKDEVRKLKEANQRLTINTPRSVRSMCPSPKLRLSSSHGGIKPPESAAHR